MPIAVCFSSDDRYAQHLGVAIASILINKAPNDRLRFYILDGGISEKNKQKLLSLKTLAECEIRFVVIDQTRFQSCPKFTISDHLSEAAYYRYILPEIDPTLDKIIYLDCDLTVNASLSEFYRLDISRFAFAGVVDCSAEEQKKFFGISQYCNSGVMLINLKKWRTDHITERLFDFTDQNREKFRFVDQDALNVLLQGEILYADKKWNVQSSPPNICPLPEYVTLAQEFDALVPTAAVVHFITGEKPWNIGRRRPHQNLYFQYLKHTPWKNFVWRYRVLSPLLGPLVNFKKNRRRIFRFRLSKNEKYLVLFGHTIFGKVRSNGGKPNKNA